MMITFCFELNKSCDSFVVVESIRNFQNELDGFNHSVKELIHFLRIFVLPAGETGAEQIVFSVVFDGKKTHFVDLLIDGYRTALLKVLKNVDRFDELEDLQCNEDLASWLFAHSHKPATYHVGTVWTSVAQIKHDHEIYLEISSFLDSRENLCKLEPQHIKRLIEELVKARFPSVDSDCEEDNTREFFRRLDASLVLLFLLLIPLLPALLLLAAMKWAFVNLIWLAPLTALTILLGIAVSIRYGEYAEEDHCCQRELRPTEPNHLNR
jgi:hypothetical protein